MIDQLVVCKQKTDQAYLHLRTEGELNLLPLDCKPVNKK